MSVNIFHGTPFTTNAIISIPRCTIYQSSTIGRFASYHFVTAFFSQKCYYTLTLIFWGYMTSILLHLTTTILDSKSYSPTLISPYFLASMPLPISADRRLKVFDCVQNEESKCYCAPADSKQYQTVSKT